jgi:hypothetical protein
LIDESGNSVRRWGNRFWVEGCWINRLKDKNGGIELVVLNNFLILELNVRMESDFILAIEEFLKEAES